MPIKIETNVGFAILFNELPICDTGRDEILCSRLIAVDLHLIKNANSPVNKFDAVNKAYVDRIKYQIATGKYSSYCYGKPYTLDLSRCESCCKWKDNYM